LVNSNSSTKPLTGRPGLGSKAARLNAKGGINDTYSILSNVTGSILSCRTANIDLGLNEVDPGMVPDGAKCGIDKVNINFTKQNSVFYTYILLTLYV
jgi:hypothetical protein